MSARGLVLPLLVAVFGAAAVVSSAQLAQPTFKTSTTRVTVDVVVTDKNDRPIDGLTVTDFQLRDRGRPQAIVDFDHVVVPLGSVPADLKSPVGPVVDVSSNAAPPPGSRAFVFVIDDGTLGGPSIPLIKRAMAEFLGAMSPDDRAAVLFIRRSDYAQDFTNDPARLIAAVNRLRFAIGWGADFQGTLFVLRNSLKVLEAAPQSRKALIYLSDGFDVTFNPETRDALLNLRPAAEMAKDRQGAGELFAFMLEAERQGVPIYTLNPRASPATNARSVRDDFLRLLSTVTGGLAAVSFTDMKQAVRGIMADNGSYYLLGYSPQPDDPDGSFHEIKVTLPDRPDLRVRARRGYVARPPITPGSAHEEVLRALSLAHPGGDLPMRGFAAPVARSDKGAEVAVTVELGYPAGTVLEREDHLRVALLALRPDGEIIGSREREVRVPGGRASSSIDIDEVVDVPRGKGSIRVSVRSDTTGRSGVIHLPLDVPKFEESATTVAPLVLGLTTPGVPVLARSEAFERLLPFQPSARREFSRGEELLVLTRVIGRTAGTTRRLRVIRAGKEVRSFGAPSGAAGADHVFRVPLTDLAPGAYSVECTLEVNRRTTSVGLPFVVR